MNAVEQLYSWGWGGLTAPALASRASCPRRSSSAKSMCFPPPEDHVKLVCACSVTLDCSDNAFICRLPADIEIMRAARLDSSVGTTQRQMAPVCTIRQIRSKERMAHGERQSNRQFNDSWATMRNKMTRPGSRHVQFIAIGGTIGTRLSSKFPANR